jgi:hypothetical protein
MVALVIAGCGIVVGGAILADSTDREASAGSLPDILWLSWLVLVALALLGLIVWRTLAPDSDWIKVAAILGLIAAAGLFPGWIFVLVDMGRGL